MKIAILSLRLHTNYGGILQSYALQTVLERLGHQVEVINTPVVYHYPPFFKIPYIYGKRLLRKVLKDKSTVIFQEYKLNNEYPVISKLTSKFINKYIHTRIIKKFSEIKENDYDAFVVGSDQVWRPIYFKTQWNSSIEDAFLSFAKDWKIKRIAYAASFGVDEWEYSKLETEECKKQLSLFDIISVREFSGVYLCKKYLGIDAQCVLDPTLLLEKECYINLIKEQKKSPGNLLVYILDPSEEKNELIKKVSHSRHLVPFSVNKDDKDIISPSVETWLKGFDDAEFIITDSFHACVFSIIFGKPFIVYGNKDRGSTRFETLLNQFSLKDNLINSLSEYSDTREYGCNIDNSILEDLRIHSLDVLKSM